MNILKTRPFIPCDHIVLNNHTYGYFNDDNPVQAYDTNDICFVAQPLASSKINDNYNILVVPLMMTDEWDIIQEHPGLINSLRSQKKSYVFNYVGQCGYMGRDVFRKLKLPQYDFEETHSVYSLPKEKKHRMLIEFLYRIASAKFVFCPRGMGSSSFRAYQAMMVGSIPIITGMNDYPFKDNVDWDQISIRGELSELDLLIEKALNTSNDQYKMMREQAISFWNNYCKHDMLYKKLEELV